MRWRRLWQLKLKTLFLFLVGAGCLTLLLLSFLTASHQQGGSRAFGRMRYSRMMSRLFRGEDDDDSGSDSEEFTHLERKWKEPQWSVAEVLRQASDGTKEKLVPVFVVEEHHEVLKYWFDAVDTGVVPKKGNTLLHIDGHSDGAPPRDFSIVPWFRLPRNHSEVANMMQSNDVFIAEAGLAGLINRYIWVWPEWDREQHTEETDHYISEVTAGWRTYYLSDAKSFQRYCVCMRSRPSNVSEFEDWECWDDEPDPEEMGGGSVIRSKTCGALLTAVVENVHESKAMKLLQTGGWLREGETILLDIDEDYFGCESSVMPLYNAGLSQNFVNNLSDLIRKFLCVSDVHTESIADKVFRTVVQIVRDFKANICSSGSPKGNTGCVTEVEADTALIQMMPRFLVTLEKEGLSELLCHGEAGEVMLQIILRTLLGLSVTQLDALNYVGVCLETAPSSMMFEPNSLHVCHGFNIPGATEVPFHVPTAEENKLRSEILHKTLSLLPVGPSLVTVCRSMRDGYTPWALFNDIEKSVMDSLQSVFSGVTQDSFHFDENLLGGRKGWPGRHH